MMKLTGEEKEMLGGKEGPVVAEAIDYLVQFGEAFGAEKLIDIVYCHYPAEMGIYEGMVEEAVGYSNTGVRVKVPTTSSTLCSDLEKPEITDIPKPLAELQAKIEPAHRRMGILETYTCTPQLLGFIPLMGYLLDENRKGTHLFKVKLPTEMLENYDVWCALGFHIGNIVGSDVPVIDVPIKHVKQEWLLGLGATLATAGSVTLFHIPGVTPEARTIEEAFHGDVPKDYYEVTEKEINVIYKKLTTIENGAEIDFVNLGCPHYNLEQIRYVADKLDGKRVADGVRCWICTNRMTRKQAEYSGFVEKIERAGAKVIADTCPVESHMRISTCKDFGLKTPNVDAMVCNSGKMLRYVGDLIGCKTALTNIDKCIESAITGRFEL